MLFIAKNGNTDPLCLPMSKKHTELDTPDAVDRNGAEQGTEDGGDDGEESLEDDASNEEGSAGEGEFLFCPAHRLRN